MHEIIIRNDNNEPLGGAHDLFPPLFPSRLFSLFSHISHYISLLYRSPSNVPAESKYRIAIRPCEILYIYERKCGNKGSYPLVHLPPHQERFNDRIFFLFGWSSVLHGGTNHLTKLREIVLLTCILQLQSRSVCIPALSLFFFAWKSTFFPETIYPWEGCRKFE